MFGDLGQVIINEMSDAVTRDATAFCPFAEGTHRRFFAFRKNSAEAKADDIGELIIERIHGWYCCFHTSVCPSTGAKRDEVLYAAGERDDTVSFLLWEYLGRIP